jgi:hypothetical protein
MRIITAKCDDGQATQPCNLPYYNPQSSQTNLEKCLMDTELDQSSSGSGVLAQ